MDTPISATLANAGSRDRRTLAMTASIYFELAKARLSALVVVTAIAGYVVAARGHGDLWTMLWLVAGTTLTAFGAAIFNQVVEAERDRRMHRTRNRPIPSGRINSREAVVWGVVSSLAGSLALAFGTNPLTAGLAMLVIVTYVAVYTPLKVRSPLNTVVGAVCGAIPPVMGWTAATNQLHGGAWILFGVLFAWQIPHFLALAWLYRSDYARGGFKMLPEVDPSGRLIGRAVLVYTFALLPLTALATRSGITGSGFLVASQLLGLAFLWMAWRFSSERSTTAARRLFLASVLYLPLVLGLMVADMDNRLGRFAAVGHESVGFEQRTSGEPPIATTVIADSSIR